MQNKQEKSYYDMRCEFYEKFKNEIAPRLRHFEKERLKVQKTLSFYNAALVLAAFIIVVLFISALNDGNGGPGKTCCEFLLFIGFIFLYCYKISISANFLEKTKNTAFSLVCPCYGDLKWHSIYKGDYSLFAKSCAIPSFDATNSYVDNSITQDDVITGNYKGVGFETVEIKVPVFRSTGGKCDTESFSGVVIKLQMNKNFNGHTVIRVNTKAHISPATYLKHTTLEDIEFEKKFDVFTSDEIEARYLLTTAFMERLKNLGHVFSSDKMSCAFYKNYFLVALYTKKDLFSICSMNKPIDDFEQYETLHNEIISIYKMIDHFKLNENTGL